MMVMDGGVGWGWSDWFTKVAQVVDDDDEEEHDDYKDV